MTLDDVYSDLLRIVSEVGAETDSQSEPFFSNIVESFRGTKEELIEYVRNNLDAWYKYLFEEPRWIQSADWQFLDGKPMVFVGQIDIPADRNHFHDDASFFLFWDPDTGETKSVLQVG